MSSEPMLGMPVFLVIRDILFYTGVAVLGMWRYSWRLYRYIVITVYYKIYRYQLAIGNLSFYLSCQK